MNQARTFHFITLFPELVSHYFNYGVLARAQRAGIVKFSAVQLRQFAVDRHGTIDGKPYGGGEGMVMRPEPLANAIESVKGERKLRVILPSPRGRAWNNQVATDFARGDSDIVFVCPRFSGVDQRLIDHFEVEEFSLGDFVVSGGELPAVMFADSIARHIPGVLGAGDSAELDSFGDGLEGRLEYPLYTRPEEIWGLGVPEVLRSGDHTAIARWRREASERVTAERRPDLG